ncbi:hypothetical protein E4K72_02945 [Oxalobacteraceae bacterium OM1]|nr:hypothetical protein E4K72_02945 [Oxalobacteraceae bacterium OM1]
MLNAKRRQGRSAGGNRRWIGLLVGEFPTYAVKAQGRVAGCRHSRINHCHAADCSGLRLCDVIKPAHVIAALLNSLLTAAYF